MTKTFESHDTFGALYEAEHWLTSNGYSYGSLCGLEPVGIVKGYALIAKWRNLTPKERNRLDGKITSENFQVGPVTVTLK